MLEAMQAGAIGTIAGTGEPGWEGDAGPATAALLNEPKTIALDAAGNLYIADSENHLVRKVEARTGIITTIAGTCVRDAPASMPAQPLPEHPEDDEDPLADPVANRVTPTRNNPT